MRVYGTHVGVGRGREQHDTRVGERVGIAWIVSTRGVCRFCTTRRENLGVAAEFTGWDHDGGYVPQTLARADLVYTLPAGFDDLDVAPLLCSGVIGCRSLKVAGVQSGMRIGVVRGRWSATAAIQVAVHWGCEVYVVMPSELEQQRACVPGAHWVGGFDQSAPAPLDAAITFAPVGDGVVLAPGHLDRGGSWR